jgi:F-type H+-transporting ATPase subunit delta
MSAQKNKARLLARQLFKLSLVDGAVSSDRVSGVLEYIEKTRPAGTALVLQAYRQLVAAELAKSEARVEHAGSVDKAMLDGIAAQMTSRYGRSIRATAKSNPALIAGLRVKVGDDVYEASVASRLAALASAS